MIKILDFIDSLRESDLYIKDIYTQGGCFQLFKLLSKMYPNCICCINSAKNHIVTYFQGHCYDINGNVGDYSDYSGATAEDLELASKWSFHKNNLISLGECQNCDEPIIYENPKNPEPLISVVQDERSEYAKDVITQYIVELAKAMNDKLEEDIRNGTIFRDTAKQPYLTEYKGFGTYCSPLRQI